MRPLLLLPLALLVACNNPVKSDDQPRRVQEAVEDVGFCDDKGQYMPALPVGGRKP